MALPLVAHLQQHDPELILLVRSGLEALFPPDTRVLTFHSRMDLWRSARSLRTQGVARMYTLPHSFSAGVALALSGARERVAFDRGPARWFATHRVPLPPRGQEHRVQNYLRMVGPPPATPPYPRIHRSPEEMEKLERLLRGLNLSYRAFLALAPFTAYGPAKTWPLDRYLEVARRVTAQGIPVVILGGPAERESAHPFTELSGVHVLVGTHPLRQSLLLLSAARAMVGNDSGLTHAAAALEVPTLALFFSTDPRWSRPLGPHVEVLQARVPCTPCHARTCPLGTYACHDQIRVAQVVEKLEMLLL